MNLKKFFVVMALVAMASAARATIMNWMVSTASGSTYIYNAAKLIAVNGGTETVVQNDFTDTSGNVVTSVYSPLTSGNYIGEAQGDITSLSGDGYSYYVEIGNYSSGSWTAVAKSSSVTYGSLVSAGVLSYGGETVPSTKDQDFTGFSAVPEPGSMGLLLMGASLMFLRRRNRKA